MIENIFEEDNHEKDIIQHVLPMCLYFYSVVLLVDVVAIWMEKSRQLSMELKFQQKIINLILEVDLVISMEPTIQ